MKISLYYESNYKKDYTWIDVPEEEFAVMIERDYRDRLARAKDGETVERRTPQEILDETSRGIYNNEHSEKRRHVSLEAYNKNGNALEAQDNVEEEVCRIDYTDLYEELKKLPPAQQELIRKVYWNGISQTRIAEDENMSRKAINNRLARIYRKMRIELNPENIF